MFRSPPQPIDTAMVRRTKRASIAGSLLAAVLACGPLLEGYSRPCKATEQNPVAQQADQHNTMVQLRPTGENHNNPVVTALAIDPRGQYLAAAGDDHVIRILNSADLSPVSELRGHVDWVQSLDFSPNGDLLVSVANDGRLLTWQRDDQWRQDRAMEGLPALRAVRFSPTGATVATVGFSPRLYLMGIGNDRRPTLTCGCRDLRTLDYRSDGMVLVAAGRSGDVFLFDAVTGSTIADVKLNRRRIREVRFVGQTSRIVTASEDGHAIIYDTDTREVIHDLHIPNCQLMSACILGENHLALGGSDNVIRIYDMNSGVLIESLMGHTGSVASLKSTDTFLYSGSFDTTVRRWNLRHVLAGPAVADGKEKTEPLIRTSRLP